MTPSISVAARTNNSAHIEFFSHSLAGPSMADRRWSRLPRTMPSVFFATAARVLPKDVAITLEQSYPGGLTPDDIAILRAIKDSIPDTDLKSPAEALSYVAEAVRAHVATTTIEASSSDT